MRIIAMLLIVVMVLGLSVMPAEARGRRGRSNSETYVDNPRNPIEGYLGVNYLPCKDWIIGARGYLDVNNLDRDDWEDNLRAEFGATWQFGPEAK